MAVILNDAEEPGDRMEISGSDAPSQPEFMNASSATKHRGWIERNRLAIL
jgi:hypothetical protein